MSPDMAAAVVAAYAELDKVAKDGTGNYGKHATIGSVLDTVKPVLARHGLAVMQYPTQSDPGSVVIITMLIHESGETFTDGGLRMPAPNEPQKVGGAITYARRYALMTFLGLADTDDDGQAAQDQVERENAPHPNSDRVADLLAALKALSPDEKEAVKTWADGKSMKPTVLLADDAWLGRVEQFVTELTS